MIHLKPLATCKALEKLPLPDTQYPLRSMKHASNEFIWVWTRQMHT